MSTVKATHFEHPSASTAGITLAADGSVVLPQGFAGGLGTNVVSTTKTDTFTTSSTSFTDLTGMSATITPSTATSKILVIVNGIYSNSIANIALFNLARGATTIAQPTSGGVSAATNNMYPGVADKTHVFSFTFLDSPAAATATTYKVQCRASSGSISVNRRAAYDERSVSSITLIEVAA